MSSPLKSSTPGKITILTILNKSDDAIKAYVASYIERGYPATRLRDILTKHQEKIREDMDRCETLVTDGTAGNARTKEEARQNLHNWANGETNKRIDNLISTLSNMTKAIQDEFRTSSSFPQHPRHASIADQGIKSMESVGKTYVTLEEHGRKTQMALDHLDSILQQGQDSQPSTIPVASP